APAVGCSRPATIRMRVVLPQPDGPRRTRSSPSSMERLTPSTARTSPKSFRTFSNSTRATRTPPRRTGRRVPPAPGPMRLGPGARHSSGPQAPFPPLGEDLADPGVGLGHRLPGAEGPCGRLGEHVGQDEAVEDLADGRV